VNKAVDVIFFLDFVIVQCITFYNLFFFISFATVFCSLAFLQSSSGERNKIWICCGLSISERDLLLTKSSLC